MGEPSFIIAVTGRLLGNLFTRNGGEVRRFKLVLMLEQGTDTGGLKVALDSQICSKNFFCKHEILHVGPFYFCFKKGLFGYIAYFPQN